MLANISLITVFLKLYLTKACKLSRANEKDLCAEDLKSEEPS